MPREMEEEHPGGDTHDHKEEKKWGSHGNYSWRRRPSTRVVWFLGQHAEPCLRWWRGREKEQKR